MTTRRRLLTAGAGLVASAPLASLAPLGLLSPWGLLSPGGLVPSSHAAPLASARRFLFVFAKGGWDTSFVFTPMAGTAVDVEPDAVVAEAHGIPYVDHLERPNVRSFFTRWGDRACVINGMEVPSITHERCRQILLTGRSDAAPDDWAALLAGNASSDLILPHLVVSGPSFVTRYPSAVVRLGEEGQLASLASGEALERSDLPAAAPSSAVEALEEEALSARLRSLEGDAALGDFSASYLEGQARAERFAALAAELDISPPADGCVDERAYREGVIALECFERDLSRCAIVQHIGSCISGWDTHQGIEGQSLNFETLFYTLELLMDELESRPGPAGGTLAEETVVVVLSEMGRHPKINANGGKDHWTYTSAMLVGSGVAGGQVIGALDGEALGQPVDLVSGGVSGDGVLLTASHLGATLLALGDVDPSPYTAAEPLLAALS